MRFVLVVISNLSGEPVSIGDYPTLSDCMREADSVSANTTAQTVLYCEDTEYKESKE